MSHRLFHTLVLSSAVLVEACAAREPVATQQPVTATSGSDSATAPAPESRVAAAAPTTPAPESGTTTNAHSREAPTADPVIAAALANARACGDVGWPTTKSASLHAPSPANDPRQFICLTADGQRRHPNTPRCCVVPAAQ